MFVRERCMMLIYFLPVFMVNFHNFHVFVQVLMLSGVITTNSN